MAGMTARTMRMPLLAIIAVLAAMAFATASGLRRVMIGLRFGRRLEPLERLRGGHEVGRKRRDGDPLPSGPLDVA
jgi:hypothetical protein